MLKKFVTLQSDVSPSKNPYEVRTYLGDSPNSVDWKIEMCEKVRKCDRPENSTISKVMTIEDELRRLNQKVKESRFQREIKKKCSKTDDFFMCTQPLRTPSELKEHSIMRERFLRVAYDLTRRVHDGSEAPLKAPSHIELASPVHSEDDDEGGDSDEEEGEEDDKKPLKPQIASPSCSLDVIYRPSEKLMSKSSDVVKIHAASIKLVWDDLRWSLFVDKGLCHSFSKSVQSSSSSQECIMTGDISPFPLLPQLHYPAEHTSPL